jgi:hypothetical protein
MIKDIDELKLFTVYRCINGFALSHIYTHGGIDPEHAYVYSEFDDMVSHLRTLLGVDDDDKMVEALTEIPMDPLHKKVFEDMGLET